MVKRSEFCRLFARANLSKKRLHVFEEGSIRVRLINHSNFKYLFLFDLEQNLNEKERQHNASRYRVMTDCHHLPPNEFYNYWGGNKYRPYSIMEILEQYQDYLEPEVISIILFNLEILR